MLFAVARRSGRVVAAVALVMYPGVALVVPVVLGWTTPWSVSANVFGASMAAAVVLTWLAVRIQAQTRRHLVEWTTDLRLLNAEEFEWFVGELFRRDGWKVE